MIVNTDWETYQTKFLGEGRTFAIENEADWTLYSQDGIFVIKCIVEKFAEQSENIMFVERYLSNNPGVIKVNSVLNSDEEVEEFPEEIFTLQEEDGQGQMVDKIIEEEIEQKDGNQEEHTTE